MSTGSITPQFHVVHDEYCTTVTSHGNLDLDTLWNQLLSISHENDWNPELDNFGKDISPPAVHQDWIDTHTMKERRDKERLRFRQLYGRELGHRSRNSQTSASSSDSLQLPRLRNHIPSSSSPQSPCIESFITSPSSSLENDLSSQQSTSLNPIFENDVVSSQSPPSNPILENDVFSSQSPPSNTSSRRSGRTRIRNKYIWSDDFTEVGHRYKKGRDNSANCAFIQSFD